MVGLVHGTIHVDPINVCNGDGLRWQCFGTVLMVAGLFDLIVSSFGSRCAVVLLKLVVGGHCSSNTVTKEDYLKIRYVQLNHGVLRLAIC